MERNRIISKMKRKKGRGESETWSSIGKVYMNGTYAISKPTTESRYKTDQNESTSAIRLNNLSRQDQEEGPLLG